MIALMFLAVPIIFEPPAYQHVVNDRVFYYGGNDPRVFETGVRDALRRSRTARSTDDRRAAVYVDALRREDASIYSFKPEDAANELAASLPTFFRKAWLVPDEPDRGRDER